jgi:small ligand-binding sensory domain FIST
MDDAIRKALEVAALAGCNAAGGWQAEPEEIAAAAIAAFLAHFSRGENLHSFTLPDACKGPGEIRIWGQQLDALAAAVRRAAGGG